MYGHPNMHRTGQVHKGAGRRSNPGPENRNAREPGGDLDDAVFAVEVRAAFDQQHMSVVRENVTHHLAADQAAGRGDDTGLEAAGEERPLGDDRHGLSLLDRWGSPCSLT